MLDEVSWLGGQYVVSLGREESLQAPRTRLAARCTRVLRGTRNQRTQHPQGLRQGQENEHASIEGGSRLPVIV